MLYRLTADERSVVEDAHNKAIAAEQTISSAQDFMSIVLRDEACDIADLDRIRRLLSDTQMVAMQAYKMIAGIDNEFLLSRLQGRTEGGSAA